MKFFNPYDLLGVSIDSTKEDVKKKYYELSLIMHPDKGGNPDDMISLKSSYEFVMKEIGVIDRSLTVEQLEDEFKVFCDTQTKQIPMFSDIYAEAFDLQKINDDSQMTMYASANGGYGDFMEKSEMTTKYNDKETLPVTNQFNAIELYQ